MSGFLKPRKGLYSLPTLKDESRQCLRNLASYKRPRKHTHFPHSKRAAVLVALFVGRSGDIYVLLSRRAETLRTYAGDTALPGGKAEHSDRHMEDTARREAFEEIGLTLDKHRVPFLCVLEPFLARDELLVTPVVVLILDNTIRPVLNEPEVRSLFSHPLIGFLSSTPPPTVHAFAAQAADRTGAEERIENQAVEVPYHTVTDVPWKYDSTRPIRAHSFLTGREAKGVKPVFGLTSSILIRVATIGYAREPDFDVDAPNQPTMRERLDMALRDQQEKTLTKKTTSSKPIRSHL